MYKYNNILKFKTKNDLTIFMIRYIKKKLFTYLFSEQVSKSNSQSTDFVKDLIPLDRIHVSKTLNC